MNTSRPQIPYVFRPPQYQPFLVGPVLKWVSRELMLKRTFKVRSVRVDGVEKLAACVKKGMPVLVTPNHADHPDPHLLVAASRGLGFTFHFMAAREGFENSPVIRWALQHAGCFSVDREGADISAIKAAMKILEEARYPLVIFPEGEIYHHHEMLDTLNEGTASIFLRASDKSLKQGGDAFVVPTAIHYRFGEEIRATFSPRLSVLEQRITWKPKPSLDPVDRIYLLGEALVSLKEMEFLGEIHKDALPDRLKRLAAGITAQVEQMQGKPDPNGAIPARVKKMRSLIRRKLTDEEHPVADPAEAAALYDQLDRLFVATQAYSYPGLYLREGPTTNRLAETILKLEEDILGKGQYPGPCDGFLKFAEPVSIRQFLETRGLEPKAAVEPLTAFLGDTIQQMIRDLARSS